MFMIDIHGTRDVATAFISSRTPGYPYWGSCIARPMRSYSRGSTSVAPAADTRPGSLRESSSMGSLRPRIGIRTRNPSELIRSASAGRQTSFTECAPSRIFDASNEPYEAPRMRMLYVDIVGLPLRSQLGLRPALRRPARCRGCGDDKRHIRPNCGGGSMVQLAV